MRARILLAVIGCLLLLISSHLSLARAGPELPACQPWSRYQELWVSPAFRDDHTLFVRSEHLLRSQDAGLTWTALAPYRAHDIYFSLNYFTDHILYMLGVDERTGEGVFLRSTDGTETWTHHQPPPSEGGLTVVPLNADTVYASRGGAPGLSTPDQGLYRTDDAGATWRQLYRGRVYSLAISPQFAADQSLLISPGDYKRSDGIQKSTDGGQTWQPRNMGLAGYNPGGQITWIQYAPGFAENRTVFLNYSEVLFRSTDAGDTWQDVTWRANLPFFIWEQVISPRYASDRTLWIWVWESGVATCLPPGPCRPAGSYISRDGGETWAALPTPEKLTVQGAGEWCQPDGSCGVVLFSRYYSPEGRTSLLKSYDYGQTWQCLEDPTLPGGQPPPPPAEIPEPATWVLLAGGGAGLAGWLRRRH